MFWSTLRGFCSWKINISGIPGVQSAWIGSQYFWAHKCPSWRISDTSRIANVQFVEVRDSRTGYLIPARYGLGVWPDGKIVGASSPPSPPSASSGTSGWHSGQETMFGGFLMVLGSWWEISENGDRGFAQNFDARLMSIVVWPGEPCLNIFLKLLRMKRYTLLEKKLP